MRITKTPIDEGDAKWREVVWCEVASGSRSSTAGQSLPMTGAEQCPQTSPAEAMACCALTPTGPCVGHRSRKPNMLIADDANVEVAGVDVKWCGVMWCGVVWDIVV